MSAWKTFRSDLSELKKEWSKMDSDLKYMDILSLTGVLVFGLAFVLVSAIDKISQTVSNMAMMVFPILVAGQIHVARERLSSDNKNIKKIKKDYLIFGIIITGLILMTFVQGIIIG